MPLDLLRVKALCFDVDGTLIDTDDQFVLRLSNWLRLVRFIFPNGDPNPFSRHLVMITESPASFLFELPDRLGLDDELTAVGDFIYRHGLGKHATPFSMISGVYEALIRLKPHYPLSIISLRGVRTVRRFIEQYRLEAIFPYVATAQTCQHAKPYPDQVLWAAEQMTVLPSECVMIGDTIVDILAGKAAGAQTIGVLSGFGEESELRKAGADEILDSAADLPRCLLEKTDGTWRSGQQKPG